MKVMRYFHYTNSVVSWDNVFLPGRGLCPLPDRAIKFTTSSSGPLRSYAQKLTGQKKLFFWSLKITFLIRVEVQENQAFL